MKARSKQNRFPKIFVYPFQLLPLEEKWKTQPVTDVTMSWGLNEKRQYVRFGRN